MTTSDVNRDSLTSAREAPVAQSPLGSDAEVSADSDASDVSFRPRHDHVLFGAAFGIETDAEGYSKKVATDSSASMVGPGGTAAGLRVAALVGLLAGALLIVHAMFGWLPWLSRVPGLASPGSAAIAGIVLAVVGCVALFTVLARGGKAE